MADDQIKSPAEAKAGAQTMATGKPDETIDTKKRAGKLKIGMPALQSREKFILRIFIVLFTLLIVDLALIHPISNYLQHLDDSIKIKEEVIPKRLLILKHKAHILSEYGELKPFFVTSLVSQEEETAQFLREIERVSKETHFFVSNINQVKINKKTDVIYELSLDVEGKGGLAEIFNFMRTIESANHSICVGAFNLKPQGKEGDELKVLFTILKLGVKKSSPSALG